MISEKMMALGKKGSVIRELFEYGKKRKAEIGDDKVFDFSLGNPSVPPPKQVDEEIRRLTKECDSIELHGYTSSAGDMNTRKAIADDINKTYNANTDPNYIYMTCGAAESIVVTYSALVSDKDDEVIILAPFFPEYRVFIGGVGAKVVCVNTKPETFKLDLDAIENAINEHTVAIMINSPNNPSGVIISEDELKSLSALLEQKQKEYNKSIYLVSDEPYRKLTYGKIVPFVPLYYRNTVVCYSYSKSLSLPGERIGYVLVPKEADSADDLFAAVCGAGRVHGHVCAPSMFQRVIAKCGELPADLDAYEKNRNLLYNGLREIGYNAVEPEGAFYLFVKALEPDANAFCENAKKFELLLVPSDDFGVTGYFRISYCVSYSQIENSLPAFKKLYDYYNK